MEMLKDSGELLLMNNTIKTKTHDNYMMSKSSGLFFLCIVLVITIVAGCKTTLPEKDITISGTGVQRTYVLNYLDPEKCDLLLDPLGLENIRYISYSSESNILVAKGTPDQLARVELVLGVVDSHEGYYIENLGPASIVRTLPSNEQIAMAIGNIDIGTFNKPPVNEAKSPAIIDIYRDSILAFLPVRYRDQLHKLLASDDIAISIQKTVQTQSGPHENLPEKINGTISTSTQPRTVMQETESKENEEVVTGTVNNKQQHENSVLATSATVQPEAILTSSKETASIEPVAKDSTAKKSSGEKESDSGPKNVKIIFKRTPNGHESTETRIITDKALPENGEDIIDMTLPETITLVQLLELAGKFMGLNYFYDPREIGNQSIALKLHGNLQGEMKVKNLYAILSSVLGNMGLAMIKQEDNLVTIVKIDKALQTQPELIDNLTNAVQIGDTVVIRAFSIRYVNVLSVMTLLQDMKLSVAATAMENTNLLLVTCHADRMNRIERLVEMIDRPGQPTECRLRRLYYTTADLLVVKIRTLAQELEGIAVSTAPAIIKPSGKPTIPVATRPSSTKPAGRNKKPVYLDTDERTNRILMIGFEEELTLIEKLIDTLDVAQADLRSPNIYNIENIDARQALDKLQKLDILKTSGDSARVSKANPGNNVLAGEPLVTILEATNQLLVRATPDQHDRIREFLKYMDVAPERKRTLENYEFKCIDASTAKRMLEELELVRGDALASSVVAGPNESSISRVNQSPEPRTADFLTDKPQVVVSESTNALLVKATAEQHEQIADIIKYIDKKMSEEELSVQIYPVENSSPEHISAMVEQLLVETREDKEGKIERIAKTEEQITIVPDPNTYSLIVYASKKNQKWIEDLIKRLDKRRPQVLIDVTLVEITRSDIFEYDLNIVANAKDAVIGNIVIDPIQKISSGSRLEGSFNMPDQDGNPTGQTKVFYSDEKIQALLTAIQRKNYGRVLAQPKVLVDDGQEGRIVTTNETTYVKESIQIPQTGTPITTRDFVSIQASIQLRITPHISEGNLLRLAVHLSRDDFGNRPAPGAPPDKATSEITTTVFVPDDRTVILGGLVKLNQSKNVSKVPILGDIPLVGGLFRSIDNSDIEKKLYVFLKANIVRPYEESRLKDLQKISNEYQNAFEKSESEFQKIEDFPGITPEAMQPERVLKDYK
jgi:type II secretory pathway component GspD/PulD (secretin)